jgi:small-conductance mechanosensitive channel
MQFDLSKETHEFHRMVGTFLQRLPHLLLALAVFLLFYLAGKAIRSVVAKVSHRQSKHAYLSTVLGRLTEGLVIIMGLLVAMVIALPSFEPGQLVQLLGISSVAVGFAFRDILQNFLAGILLLLTRPFRIGDQIHFGDYEGIVEDIQTRATMLRTYDSRRIVIPNSELFTKSVTVNTAYEERRLEYEVGIGYGDDVEEARKLILDAIGGIEEVLDKPEPEVLLLGLGASSVNLKVRWWINPPKRSEAVVSQDKVLTAIKKALAEHGIDLPYDTRVVLFHDQTEETDGDRRRQREGWPAGKGEAPGPRKARTEGAGDGPGNGGRGESEGSALTPAPAPPRER